MDGNALLDCIRDAGLNVKECMDLGRGLKEAFATFAGRMAEEFLIDYCQYRRSSNTMTLAVKVSRMNGNWEFKFAKAAWSRMEGFSEKNCGSLNWQPDQMELLLEEQQHTGSFDFDVYEQYLKGFSKAHPVAWAEDRCVCIANNGEVRKEPFPSGRENEWYKAMHEGGCIVYDLLDDCLTEESYGICHQAKITLYQLAPDGKRVTMKWDEGQWKWAYCDMPVQEALADGNALLMDFKYIQ